MAAAGVEERKWSKFLEVDSVQELAEKHLHEVPERYVRPLHERPSDATNSDEFATAPVIDLAQMHIEECRQDEMAKLGRACEEWGFFQVVNHGIPHGLLDEMRRVARGFFKLPEDEKRRWAPQGEDVQGYGQMFVVSEDQKLDWGDLLALTLEPPNLRNMSVWPINPVEFRATVESYSAEIQKLARKLLTLFAENLKLKGDYFNDKFGDNILQRMRINYYPPCPRPDLVVGLSPHSDGGGITLLLQDDDDSLEGLHIRKGDRWISVKPIPHALIINIADFIEVMTNGRYKSVEHRAVTNVDKARLSIAVFHCPSYEAEVYPAPDLIHEPANPCLYRKFTQDEYIRNYLGKKLEGKSMLSQFKIRTDA